MTPALWALVGYAAWTMVLVLAVLLARVPAVLSGRTRMNQFPSGVQHGSDRYWRLNRAHVNAVENLPIVAILVVVGTLAHVHSRLFLFAPVAALGARVVQSIVHVAWNTVPSVTLRFTAFFAQYVCFAVMIVEIARAAL